MLTSEPPRHPKSRRRLQPSFTRASVDSYIPEMTSSIERELDTWQDGASLDLGAAMSRITLAVAGRCLFGVDLGAEQADQVSGAIADALGATYGRLGSSAASQRGRAKRLAKAKATFARITDLALGAGAGCPFAEGKVPAALRASELSAGDKSEEALTILLAAQESLSIGLTWTLTLLSRHPDVAARLRAQPGPEGPGYRSTDYPPEQGGDTDSGALAQPGPEGPGYKSMEYPSGAEAGATAGLDQVGTGERASMKWDITSMPYARAVLAESMRLYPPAWLLTREATRDVRLADDLTVDSGTVVFAAPCVSHVDPRHWERADEFSPERWLSEYRPQPGLYIPFGLGPRNCIGEQFAWTEGTLAIAAIARRFIVEIDAHVPIAYSPLVNLRPRDAVTGKIRFTTNG